MSLRRILKACLILALANSSLLASAAAKDNKNSACEKPPELVSSPKPTKEEQKARKLRAQGAVAISISEDGEVVDAKVVRSSSPEAVELLLARAKSMKFKPRPGCGIRKITVNYTLAQ